MCCNQKRPTFLFETVKVVLFFPVSIRAIHYTFEIADYKPGFDRRFMHRQSFTRRATGKRIQQRIRAI